jgi:hypothetical protein
MAVKDDVIETPRPDPQDSETLVTRETKGQHDWRMQQPGAREAEHVRHLAAKLKEIRDTRGEPDATIAPENFLVWENLTDAEIRKLFPAAAEKAGLEETEPGSGIYYLRPEIARLDPDSMTPEQWDAFFARETDHGHGETSDMQADEERDLAPGLDDEEASHENGGERPWGRMPVITERGASQPASSGFTAASVAPDFRAVPRRTAAAETKTGDAVIPAATAASEAPVVRAVPRLIPAATAEAKRGAAAPETPVVRAVPRRTAAPAAATETQTGAAAPEAETPDAVTGNGSTPTPIATPTNTGRPIWFSPPSHTVTGGPIPASAPSDAATPAGATTPGIPAAAETKTSTDAVGKAASSSGEATAPANAGEQPSEPNPELKSEEAQKAEAAQKAQAEAAEKERAATAQKRADADAAQKKVDADAAEKERAAAAQKAEGPDISRLHWPRNPRGVRTQQKLFGAHNVPLILSYHPPGTKILRHTANRLYVYIPGKGRIVYKPNGCYLSGKHDDASYHAAVMMYGQKKGGVKVTYGGWEHALMVKAHAAVMGYSAKTNWDSSFKPGSKYGKALAAKIKQLEGKYQREQLFQPAPPPDAATGNLAVARPSARGYAPPPSPPAANIA